MTFPIPSVKINNNPADVNTTKPVDPVTVTVYHVGDEVYEPIPEVTQSEAAATTSEKEVHFDEKNADTQSSTRSLQPRNSIKPAERYDDVYYYYDEDVYEVSVNDEQEKGKLRELCSWREHNLYKEVDRNE